MYRAISTRTMITATQQLDGQDRLDSGLTAAPRMDHQADPSLELVAQLRPTSPAAGVLGPVQRCQIHAGPNPFPRRNRPRADGYS